MVRSLSGSEETVFLQQGPGEMSHGSEMGAPGGQGGGQSRLLAVLEDLWRWLSLKEEELVSQGPAGGDVLTLLQ
ncbi:hypothetical protein AAFF_G00411470 [Aldrovandia affinis]|uniref:Uncharacterized protein n=1 Tax=Aldrovandia affinis TaxID=143900 RepID=A0AAD7WJY4_9TELE|nr:hypothetical protein AAFF_G00411470 [Aldrovandia affinis]